MVGSFATDLVVEELVILELKAKERLVEAHEAQLLNYLRSTTIEIGLLLNFGKQPEFRRKYFANENKTFSQQETSHIFEYLLETESGESA